MLSGTILSPVMSNKHEISFLYDLGNIYSIHCNVLDNLRSFQFFFYILAKELNHSVSNEYDLIEFLNTIDISTLFKKTFEPIYINANGSKLYSRRWTPVVEGIKFVFLLQFNFVFQILYCI